MEVEEVLRGADGLHRLPNCPADVLAAVACGAVLSCTSAAQDHGLPVAGDPPIHVAAPRGTVRTWRRVVVHRRDVPHDGRRTEVLRTVVDTARCAPLHEAVGIGDHALHHGVLGVDDIVRARAASGLDDPAHRALLDAGAASPPGRGPGSSSCSPATGSRSGWGSTMSAGWTSWSTGGW